MATVNTVLGPVDTFKLGFTNMHEHLMLSSTSISKTYPELLDDKFMDRVIAGLTKAKQAGINTVVDASTFDLGRNVSLMSEASKRTGVNIICVTGLRQGLPRFFANVTADQYAQLFIREIKEGIEGTGIKPGVLKGASDAAGVLPVEELILRGLARAHLQTGVPIMLHSDSPAQIGRRQVAILKEEGVDLKRVKIDHSNDTDNVEYLKWLLEQGCYLGLDRYPGRTLTPQIRTKILKTLIDAGYASRLLLSHDWSLAMVATLMPSKEREAFNPHGYLYVKNVVFPMLLEMGVPEATVNSLCVNGPRNFFEGV